ncbi:CPBP family intramembrane glutamic endopeptidase [Glaciecola sp. 1036]|uniref:CPBP family intramembrane glutamic endopeptidase n=1 Tax=Alteromonadaceae TaxID=72275 RepID=UPI003D0330D0
MIGLILFAISWILLRLQKRPISELGFNKPVQRSVEFIGGLIIAAVFASFQFVLIAHFSDFNWQLNPEYSLSNLIQSLRWNLNSVLYEELLFRGYLLYKAIEYLGVRKACLLSAVAFGIYHWFSYGIWGALVPMVYVFILTGSFGLMTAYAFAKSKSVILPIALHLGWNLTTNLIFSNGPIGQQLLVPSISDPKVMESSEQIIANIIIPLSFVSLVLWIVTKKIARYRH